VGARDVIALSIPGLQVGAALRPLFGQERSGDLAVALAFPGGALVGAIDGLGHGHAAAEASEAALVALRDAPGASLPHLFALCDSALVGTRGAVMTLVSFDFAAGELTWFGVGNVEARLLRADAAARAEAPMLLGGVVGQSMPSVRASRLRLSRGDMLVLATDGVGPDFSRGAHHGSVDRIAGRILVEHGRVEDDALVVVARYLGSTMPD
jgi:negative regulator of sigma-B (phosphoserine phosphatase)